MFQETLASAVADDSVLSTFYGARDWAPVWTGASDAARREALLTALSYAPDHGLPPRRYDEAGIVARFHEAMGERDRGLLEAEVSRRYLAYARDINSGVLVPGRVDSGIVREVRRPDPAVLMEGIAGSSPAVYLAGLVPQSQEYALLLREKTRLESARLPRDMPPDMPRVGSEVLKPGQSGKAVGALRQRLAALGYRSGEGEAYDEALTRAVSAFQADHGLADDGVAGGGTIAEANRDPADRLGAVMVAMERERWTNFDRGRRHIWVNLTDFQVKVVDEGRITFRTRSVIGKDVPDRRTPEFSDMMRFVVVNPTWNVPRSITTKEYLPQLQRNPNAVSHIQVMDRSGNVVDRAAVDFTQFSAASFPYIMRQTPGDGNALGRVKFMFPNKWNIYLHDTPSKSLFKSDVRAYSHGCIRLNDPLDFAYTLLAPQEADPKALMKRILAKGKETTLTLKEPVPVHLDYRTAFADENGRIVYRSDIYGRDGRILDALMKAGVVMGGVRG